jgi:hypothetical protein
MAKEDPVAEALYAIAGALQRLGNADASTPFGGLEGHGIAITEAAEKIAEGLSDVASAIRELAAKRG